MNILLDALPLNRLTTGMSRYVRNLYLQMEKLSSVNVRYFGGYSCTTEMPVNMKPDVWIKNTSLTRRLPAPASFGLHSVGWLLYEKRLRRCAKNNGFHVYHETNFIPAEIKDVPQVLTIYDLSLMKFRETHPRSRVWFSDLFFKRRMKYVAHIITISDFVRSEICDDLHIDGEKVTAIPLAPSPFFFPRDREKSRGMIKELGLPKDFLLFVGTLEPRKNLSLLVKTLAVCKHDIPIVLVGWDGWGNDEWLKTAEKKGLRKRIFTTGYVDEETLACLYSSALALVFPSLYEGFGLPVLEAMACGCPVICSNVASLPEVAGDAGILFDPFQVEDLGAAIDKVAGDCTLREDLIQKGLLRAAQFSWENTAKKTLEVFRAVSGQD